MVNATPRPSQLTRRKDPVPPVQEAGCSSGPVLTGKESPASTEFDPRTGPSSPLRDAIPTTQARSSLMDVPNYTMSHTRKHPDNRSSEIVNFAYYSAPNRDAVPKLWDRRTQDSVLATASGRRHTTVSTAYLERKRLKGSCLRNRRNTNF